MICSLLFLYGGMMVFKKYDLSECEIKGLANLALQEQGSIDGGCAELSLMANLFEQQTKYDSLYDYVRNGGWFSRAAHWMDNGSAGETYRQYTRYVLCNGLRTLPAHINEHDCFSDIKSISTGDVRDRSAYQRDITIIKNRYGSTYTFYCFPTASSDPFGYTKDGGDMSGKIQNLIDREWELAQIPYEETGENHQIFSSIVNNAGLEGCQNQPWCCTYQFAMDVMEFGVDKALKLWNMSPETYCGYSCFETFDTFERAGKTGSVPKLGALVIFKHSHVGRVLAINEKSRTFDAGEGNTSNAQYDRNGNACAVKTYSFDDSRIKGFCYIDYEEQKKERTGTLFEFGNVTFNKKGEMRGDDYVLQTLLRGRGFKGADGKELKLDGVAQENTMYAANAYMDARARAGVDLGECDCWGPKCWADVFGRKAIEI